MSNRQIKPPRPWYGGNQNPNAKLVSDLREIARLNDLLGEDIRGKAYTVAARNIEKLDYKITPELVPNEKERKISGVGKGIAAKISEFVNTGRIAELDRLHADKVVQAHEFFSKIAGVGPATIDHWISRGIYTLGDLRNAIRDGTVILTNMQRIGLRHYSALIKRHPRSFGTVVLSDMLVLLRRIAPNIIAEVAGSYRRGREDIGDIDIILTVPMTPGSRVPRSILPDLHKTIEDDPRCGGIFSWGEHRATFVWCTGTMKDCAQVDLLFAEYPTFYAALNYFTGSQEHNEYLRLIAKKKGYRLNQYGLFEGNKLLPMTSEREIYDTLGVTFVEPKFR